MSESPTGTVTEIGSPTVQPARSHEHIPAGEREASTLRQLVSAQKPAGGAPAYSRFINRPAGRILAAGAYRLRMTPNGVTAVSAAFSFCGIAVLAVARPTWWAGLVVAFLLVIGYALDSADGQLARLLGGGSLSGEWLDHVIDCLKISALHAATLVYLYRINDIPRPALLIVIGFGIVAPVLFFVIILNEQLSRRTARSKATKPPASFLRSVAVAPTDYGLLCLTFVLIGRPPAFLWVYGVLFAGSTAYLALGVVKWFRDLQRADRLRSAA